ncbi:MAG: hypothetical protein LBU99_07650 [Spirochaetaceae bacterium]|jgi:hypothetical protein|nr:hypothetical protein [Spirochaetaceae bacterium]
MKPQFKHTKLSVKARFLLAGMFYLAAAMLHLVLLRAGATGIPVIICWAGVLLLSIPLFFLAARNYTNKPDTDRVQTAGAKATDTPKSEWKQVTMTELDRLRDHMQRLRKTSIPIGYGKTGITLLSVIAAVTGFLSLLGGNRTLAFMIADLYLIFAPGLWFMRVQKWYPPGITKALREFGDIISYQWSAGVKLVPSFYLEKDSEGKDFPTDLKVMIEPSPKPQDLMGAQFQLTHNKGPNGNVPYMYVVFITHGKGSAWRTLKQIRYNGFVTEAGSSIEEGTEYGTVVLRLDTTARSDGYHTKRADIDRLMRYTAEALLSVKQ